MFLLTKTFLVTLGIVRVLLVVVGLVVCLSVVRLDVVCLIVGAVIGGLEFLLIDWGLDGVFLFVCRGEG